MASGRILVGEYLLSHIHLPSMSLTIRRPAAQGKSAAPNRHQPSSNQSIWHGTRIHGSSTSLLRAWALYSFWATRFSSFSCYGAQYIMGNVPARAPRTRAPPWAPPPLAQQARFLPFVTSRGATRQPNAMSNVACVVYTYSFNEFNCPSRYTLQLHLRNQSCTAVR